MVTSNVAATVQAGETMYRLILSDGSEGELADYGSPSFCTAKSGEQFMALIEDPDATEAKVYRLDPVSSTTEEVLFDTEEEEYEDGLYEDDEDDEDGEPEDGE